MSGSPSWIAGAGACLIAGAVLASLQGQPDRLTFVSVGQGDCTILQTGGRTVLIDDGPVAPHWDAGERIVVPELKELGADSVDLILLSHPDLDHIGGTGAVLKTFPDAKIAVSEEFRNDEHMLSRLASWGKSPKDVAWLPAHEAGRIGNFSVTIDSPRMQPGDEDNNGSMFVRIQESNASAVFSGDAPMSVEEAEAASGKWAAEILHVGHHGSKTATSDRWLQVVDPKFAIISCGRNNRYGHPHLATLQRLAAHHILVERTDREGSIRFVVRNGEFVRER